jgi:hypothetical protein
MWVKNYCQEIFIEDNNLSASSQKISADTSQLLSVSALSVPLQGKK